MSVEGCAQEPAGDGGKRRLRLEGAAGQGSAVDRQVPPSDLGARRRGPEQTRRGAGLPGSPRRQPCPPGPSGALGLPAGARGLWQGSGGSVRPPPGDWGGSRTHSPLGSPGDPEADIVTPSGVPTQALLPPRAGSRRTWHLLWSTTQGFGVGVGNGVHIAGSVTSSGQSCVLGSTAGWVYLLYRSQTDSRDHPFSWGGDGRSPETDQGTPRPSQPGRGPAAGLDMWPDREQ